MAAVIVVVAAGLVATACIPPSQTPVDQPVPPGGRVLATGPALTEMRIEGATDDLTTILYARNPFIVDSEAQVPYRFWVVDAGTGSTDEVPVGRAEFGSAALAPDGRSVVFASNDPALQVGPTAANCVRWHGDWRPLTQHVCDELYLFDLDTGTTRQLTGLDGSSPYGHLAPRFTDDGTAVDVLATSGQHLEPLLSLRVDLATGAVTDTPAAPPCCTWTHGTTEVTWDGATETLTSRDTTTGVLTTLWDSDENYGIAAVRADGRFVVLSTWVEARTEVFRLVDTDTGSVRPVPSRWISEDAARYAVVQTNVAPEGIDRLVLAPLPG